MSLYRSAENALAFVLNIIAAAAGIGCLDEFVDVLAEGTAAITVGMSPSGTGTVEDKLWLATAGYNVYQ